MKSQRSATSRPLSKLSRFLLAVLALKICVLGAVLFEYALPQLSLLSSFKAEAAIAAEEPAPAAPAAPPVAVAPSTAGGAPAPGGLHASSGVSEAPAGAEPGRTLPPISASPGQTQTTAVASTDANATEPSLSRDALALRQEELARKEQELRALEADISDKLEQMQVLDGRLQGMMRQADETNDAKFRHTVDVLSNMKAKQAAAVLSTLEERIAVRVLAGMRGRQAGEILTFVDPVKAARLTESLVRMQLPYE